MRYAGIIPNDFLNGENICVSYWAQGCPFHCKECHNPETWDFNSGTEKPIEEIIKRIKELITKNGIQRNFSILGGEPCAPQNIKNTITIAKEIRKSFPDIIIYLWTGYNAADLTSEIKELADVIIDGQYKKEERDVTLPLRGSRNQRVLRKGKDF